MCYQKFLFFRAFIFFNCIEPYDFNCIKTYDFSLTNTQWVPKVCKVLFLNLLRIWGLWSGGDEDILNPETYNTITILKSMMTSIKLAKYLNKNSFTKLFINRFSCIRNDIRLPNWMETSYAKCQVNISKYNKLPEKSINSIIFN